MTDTHDAPYDLSAFPRHTAPLRIVRAIFIQRALDDGEEPVFCFVKDEEAAPVTFRLPAASDEIAGSLEAANGGDHLMLDIGRTNDGLPVLLAAGRTLGRD